MIASRVCVSVFAAITLFMETNGLKEHLNCLLAKGGYAVKGEPNVIDQARLVRDAQTYAPLLLQLLLADNKSHKVFFKEVSGVVIFLQQEFIDFVRYNTALNSYSRYLGKTIGLYQGDTLIGERGDVVLNFPFKDCVLEGGMSKEEVTDFNYEYDATRHDFTEVRGKRREVFYNEILARDEIDRLFAPKAFCNAKRYDVNGAHPLTCFHRDAQGRITDNLIVKGNNLLALHSLSKEFAGRVKLIYIDPPYYFSKTKGTDSFCYNSNFKLSTWLTFMRNRLEVAKNFLADNGVIMCHINEDSVHWLKVLMEQIFKSENFVETFIWKNTDNPDSLSKKSRSSVEYILCFEKHKDASMKYIGKETENGDAPLLNTGNNTHVLTFPPKTIHFNIADGLYKASTPDKVELLNDVQVINKTNENQVSLKGEFKWGQSMLDKEISQGTYFLVKSSKFSIRFQRPQGTTMAPEKYFDEQYLSKAIGVGTNEDANNHLKKMGIKFSNPKPESVVAYFVKAVTNKGDYVMDFFAGSGTTAAVALKMGRKFITVDQMDYIETETLKRLECVISGEQGGISKSVNWQGGGNFVYMEMGKRNERAMEMVTDCKNYEELCRLFDELANHYFLDYNLNIQGFRNILTSPEFKALALDRQKEMVFRTLDLNQMWICADEADEAYNGLTDEDRKVTRMFYGTEQVTHHELYN